MMREEKMMDYTMEQIERIKQWGNEWHKGDMHRVYLNNGLGRLYGIETERYGSGNIMSAKLDGQPISNSEAKRLLSRLAYSKFWFDLSEQKFHCSGEMAGTGMMQKIVAAIDAKLETNGEREM